MNKLYKEIKMIDVNDWDRLVIDTYKRPYNFQQQAGCQSRGIVHISVPNYWGKDCENESIPEVVNGEDYGVSFKAWLERDPTTPLPTQKYDWELNLFWERNFYPDIGMIINDLHTKGLLEKGDYIINIDW
jgi:hypothetical protein